MQAFWESFHLDPRQPQNASMRASDSDREIARGALADAYADGRLRREEYDERLATLYESRTLGDLPSLVTDLVAPGEPAAAAPAPLLRPDLRKQGERKWRKTVEESVSAFLGPTVICLVIWVLTGRGFFWPAFPMVILGINVVRTIIRREAVIEQEVLRLQKKQEKEAFRLQKKQRKKGADELEASPAGDGDQDEPAG